MKIRLMLAMVALFFCNAQVNAQNENAKLTKVTITFRTHNDNKDHDTKLYVKIKSKVNLFLSKDVAFGNELGGDMEFVDPSNHSFDLTLNSSTIKVSDLTAPFISIDVQPNGNDRWIFDYSIRLEFSDGNAYSSESQGVILDQDNRHHEGIFTN